jgi:hypothetical protein
METEPDSTSKGRRVNGAPVAFHVGMGFDAAPNNFGGHLRHRQPFGFGDHFQPFGNALIRGAARSYSKFMIGITKRPPRTDQRKRDPGQFCSRTAEDGN